MKTRFLIIAVILMMLLVSSCASNKAEADLAKLRAQLHKWTSFRSEGVVQINYMGFSLRKFYVAQKNGEEMRLDVIDGGIMGSTGSPLLSIYKGEYIALKSPMMPQLELLDLESLFPIAGFNAFSKLDSLVTENAEEILQFKSLVLPGLMFGFDKSLRISEIQDAESGARLAMTYDRRGEPDKIEINLDGSAALTMLVDNMSYGPQVIEPLPRPNFSGGDLMKLFMQELNRLGGSTE